MKSYRITREIRETATNVVTEFGTLRGCPTESEALDYMASLHKEACAKSKFTKVTNGKRSFKAYSAGKVFIFKLGRA